MKIFYIFFLLLRITLFISQAQNNVCRLDGLILDSLSGQPLPYAKILLVSDLNKFSTTSNENGIYNLNNIPNNSYHLSVHYIGYHTKKIPIMVQSHEAKISIPTIFLNLENVNLDQVTVKAIRPFIEQSFDKIILNISESVMTNSGTILDVLRRSPTVQVNENDGTVSLKGKKVLILIDNKPTQLTGENLESFLLSIPSINIDRIELISNPSSKYEASGLSIINIHTLKMKTMGSNASLNIGSTFGKKNSYNGSSLFNYKKNKVSISSSYSHQYSNQYVIVNSLRLTSVNQSLMDSEYYQRIRRLQYCKISSDYNLTDKNTIGVLFQGNFNKRYSQNTSQTIAKSNSSQIDSTIIVNTDSKVAFSNWSANINFRHNFNTKSYLTLDGDFSLYDANWNELFLQHFFKNNSIIEYKPSSSIRFPWGQKNYIQSIKSDYTLPLKSGIIESGIQIRTTKMDMNFKFMERNNGLWMENIENSFFYNYIENVQASYVNYSSKKESLSYQIGLRYEFSKINVGNFELNSKYQKIYNNIFPSLSFYYSYNKKNILSLSFTKRITCPTYNQLNERPTYFNPYRQTVGNKYLHPTLTSSLEAGININNSTILTLGYTLNKNDITLVPFILDKITQYKYFNFNKSEIFSIDISLNKNILPWWNTNSGVQYFYIKNNFNNIEELSNRQGKSMYIRSTNYFNLKNGLKLEISGFYYPPQESGAFKVLDLKKVDVGVQKSILKSKGDLRLSVTDVFNSLTTRYLFYTNKVQGDEEIKTETRFLKITLLYRFGNLNVKLKERKSGIERESNRIDK